MRRVAIILCAALFVALPTISHAQYNDTDQQHPKEYHDEDSQPLAIIADLLYPIGYGGGMAGRAPDALALDRQSRSAGFQSGGRQRHNATAAGSNYSRQHDGPGGVVDHTAGLVSDAHARHDERDRDQAVGTAAVGTAAGRGIGLGQPAGASLNFRVPQSKHHH